MLAPGACCGTAFPGLADDCFHTCRQRRQWLIPRVGLACSPETRISYLLQQNLSLQTTNLQTGFIPNGEKQCLSRSKYAFSWMVLLELVRHLPRQYLNGLSHLPVSGLPSAAAASIPMHRVTQVWLKLNLPVQLISLKVHDKRVHSSQAGMLCAHLAGPRKTSFIADSTP